MKDISTKGLPIRIVIVTMFETSLTDDIHLSELDRWRERQPLDKAYRAPHLQQDYHVNEDKGVLSVLTGLGTAKAASAIMALGLDTRFDLTKAYWIIAGIAGFDPSIASLGSVAIGRWIVSGDLAYAIDPREIPNNWSTGYFPIFSKGPFDNNHNKNNGEVFKLNENLANWALKINKNMRLIEDAESIALGKAYEAYPNAQESPSIIHGDCLSSMTFFHGKHFTDWAQQWVNYWTQGNGQFVASAMEDVGIYQSMAQLDTLKMVDLSRLILLRSASNFTLPPAGISPSDYLCDDVHNHFSGTTVALENVYRVGNHISESLLDNWETYKETPPVHQ